MAFSRFTWALTFILENVVKLNVSSDISTLKEFSVFSITDRHTPLTEILSPIFTSSNFISPALKTKRLSEPFDSISLILPIA